MLKKYLYVYHIDISKFICMCVYIYIHVICISICLNTYINILIPHVFDDRGNLFHPSFVQKKL